MLDAKTSGRFPGDILHTIELVASYGSLSLTNLQVTWVAPLLALLGSRVQLHSVQGDGVESQDGHTHTWQKVLVVGRGILFLLCMAAPPPIG